MSKINSKFLLGILMVAAFAFTFVNTTSAAITMTLKQGMNNSQVKELQQNLNAAGFTISTTGAGSAGMETTYFGTKTKLAVQSYQTSKGLTADGIFGPASRAAWTGGTMSFPAGCTSSSGYSSTTGMPCATGGTTLPAGCTTTAGFSPTTGVSCSTGMPTSTLPAGCTTTTGFSATTGLACSATTQTGPVGAVIATNNPASGTLVAGQATAHLANFTFNGTGTVTTVTLQRIGVSADSTPSNVYLFDGAMRLTDAASVSNNGTVTFNIPAGIFTVNGSKTISVKSDIAANTSGQTLGFQLATFATSAGTVTANLSGNIHTIASATLASVAANTVTPSGATLNPGANVTVWQSTLNISNRDVWMKRLALRNVGSAPANAFANFKLYVNGVQVGTATGVDINGYVTFDLMASPVLLVSGSRVVRVDADIVSGASRTVNFSLRNAADVDFVDSSFGVNIAPTSAPWGPLANNTISGTNGGSLTIEKDPSSPSANVTLAGNDVTLGIFKMTAYGESIKVETLTVGHTTTGTVSLRNGRLMISTDGVNWVQYGSTATLLAAGTSFTTNYTIMPGTPVWLKVNADVVDNDGTPSLVAGNTILINVLAGTNNAQRVDSLGSFNAPGATVSGNTVTAATATATLTSNPTYANQNTVLPTTAFKIGSYNLAGSSVEDILLTTISVDLDETTGTTVNEDDITNMYVVVKDSNGNVVAQPSPIATVTAGGQDSNFSINYTLMKNTNVTVEVFANIASNTPTINDAFRTDMIVSGTAMISGTAIATGEVTGQTITYTAATITATVDASSPVTAIVYDNQTVTTGAFKFAAVTASYNVTDITVTVANATNVQSIMLYDGATLVATQPGSTSATFSGLTWNVPANMNKVLTVKLMLGNVGIGAGTSGAGITTAISAFTAVNTSTGVSDASANDAGPSIENNPTAAAMYVYASTPTVTNVALPTTILSTGTQTVAKFSVASNGGTIGWKKMIFAITKTLDIGGAGTLATPTLWDADTNTQIAGVATFTGSIEVADDLAGGLTFVATNEQQVSGTKNYVLKMVVAGALDDGDNINVNIAQPDTYVAPAAYATVAAANGGQATFVWTDTSAASHDETTLDWNNGFLVKNLPTDTQTLTK